MMLKYRENNKSNFKNNKRGEMKMKVIQKINELNDNQLKLYTQSREKRMVRRQSDIRYGKICILTDADHD